ncbi:hypothetical protein ACS0TY_022465 [Phlomoides rotata]
MKGLVTLVPHNAVAHPRPKPETLDCAEENERWSDLEVTGRLRLATFRGYTYKHNSFTGMWSRMPISFERTMRMVSRAISHILSRLNSIIHRTIVVACIGIIILVLKRGVTRCRDGHINVSQAMQHASEYRGLRSSRNITVSEKVAMFLCILAHHTKNHCVKFQFKRSGQTVSKHFSCNFGEYSEVA